MTGPGFLVDADVEIFTAGNELLFTRRVKLLLTPGRARLVAESEMIRWSYDGPLIGIGSYRATIVRGHDLPAGWPTSFTEALSCSIAGPDCTFSLVWPFDGVAITMVDRRAPAALAPPIESTDTSIRGQKIN